MLQSSGKCKLQPVKFSLRKIFLPLSLRLETLLDILGSALGLALGLLGGALCLALELLGGAGGRLVSYDILGRLLDFLASGFCR